MRLFEVTIIHETVLSSKITPMEHLLTTKLTTNILPTGFTLLDASITEAINSVGNYVLITRVTIEYSSILKKEELADYVVNTKDDIKELITELLGVKSNVIELRSHSYKLI